MDVLWAGRSLDYARDDDLVADAVRSSFFFAYSLFPQKESKRRLDLERNNTFDDEV